MRSTWFPRMATAFVVSLVLGVSLVVPASSAPAEDPASVSIHPRPHELTVSAGRLRIPPAVVVVRGAGTDGPALDALTAALRDAGVRSIEVGTTPAPRAGLTIYLGGPSENPATADVLDSLSARDVRGLPAEGYVLATGRVNGRGVAALAGVDGAGTFYAVQSFRQLLADAGRGLPVLAVRDWPAAETRGVIEGFYGTPWSQADRLDQLAFYGAHKMNTYEYSPKDDPYLRERWRDPYPDEQLATLTELVDAADANHVRFAYALSPGLSVCYSSDADIAALVAKFEQMYAIGVRTFTIPLDDISYTTWNCEQDGERFGTGPAAAGAAQSSVLNRVNAEFVKKHSDVRPLETVATEYYTITDSPYKTAIREQLDRDVVVMWTGTAVVPAKITVAEVTAAEEVFGHDMLLWDNYPVNDYMRGRLAMAPYLGRDDGVASAQVGIVANPMNQAAVSKIGLFAIADFAWNDQGFDPRAAWTAGATEYAGGDANVVEALRWFADAENWMETIDPVEAPRLAAAVEEFWTAWRTDDQSGIDAFATRLQAFSSAPEVIRAGVEPAFAREAEAWLNSMGYWGQAMTVSLDMLRAQRAGDGARAWADRQRIPALVAAAAGIDPVDGKTPIKVANSVADAFVRDAVAANDRWFGLGAGTAAWTASGGPPPEPGSSVDGVVDRNLEVGYSASSAPSGGEELTVTTTDPVPLAAVLVAIPDGRQAPAEVEALATDGTWHPLGQTDTGYAELRVGDDELRFTAVRLRWSSTSVAPAVAEIVPLPAGAPVALSVSPPSVDVEIGEPATAAVSVDGIGLAPTEGVLEFTGPAGISVSPPQTRVRVGRGDRWTVPITVDAADGTQLGAGELTATVAGVSQRIPIHVYPHTSDRNVALTTNGATATASCVELDDPTRFAPEFATDADQKTRWSSCYDDNASWSVALARPEQLSTVVVRWEASYAAAYQLQVSTDGETWTTVVDQPTGTGGVETIRFDPVTATHVRMQGVKRSSTWGYSFYEFEVYPVE
jgi:hyaluronoglucosaminidase